MQTVQSLQAPSPWSSPFTASNKLRSAAAVPCYVSARAGSRTALATYIDVESLGHHPHFPTPSLKDLDEEGKRHLVEEAEEQIRRQTERRAAHLKAEAHTAHLNSELKFGKMMMAEGKYEAAMAHFSKVAQGSADNSYHRGEAVLQKGHCLDKMGRRAEARALFESLIQFRAPYPNIKRRAAQALLWGEEDGEGEGTSVSAKAASPSAEYDDYMQRLFLTGFGSYIPKEKYVETEEEKTVMKVLPWAILLMAPALLLSLFLFPK